MMTAGCCRGELIDPLRIQGDAEHSLYTWTGTLTYAQESQIIESVASAYAGRCPGRHMRQIEYMVLMETLANARFYGFRTAGMEAPSAGVDCRLYHNGIFDVSVANYVTWRERESLGAYLDRCQFMTVEQRIEMVGSRLRSTDTSHEGAGIGLVGTFAWADMKWRFKPVDENLVVFTMRMTITNTSRNKKSQMKTLYIDQTKYTPLVRFDPNARVFTMRGVSRPEHTVEFFRPIISWLDAFVEEELRREAPVEPIRLVFDLDYFNSISSKYIMGIILKSKQLFPAENGLTIEWHYTPGDEENRGIGEDMSYIAGMGFLLLERES